MWMASSALQGVYEIMERCWLMEPRERPTFTVLEQLLAKNFGEWRERRGNTERERERERSRGVGERKKGARKRGERRERNDKLERGKERGRKKERWGKGKSCGTELLVSMHGKESRRKVDGWCVCSTSASFVQPALYTTVLSSDIMLLEPLLTYLL